MRMVDTLKMKSVETSGIDYILAILRSSSYSVVVVDGIDLNSNFLNFMKTQIWPNSISFCSNTFSHRKRKQIFIKAISIKNQMQFILAWKFERIFDTIIASMVMSALVNFK